MLALRLRRLGHSVVVFEASSSLGGAWQAEDLGGVGKVECACHLLEWYAGGYESLSRFSDADFIPCDPQPIRVYLDGRRQPYTSRAGIARSAYYHCRAVLAQAAKLVVRRRSPMADRLWALWASVGRLQLFARYTLPGLVRFRALCRPKGGYVAYIDGLIDAVRDSGVEIVLEQVTALESSALSVTVKTRSQTLSFKRVYVGDSTVLSDQSDAPVSDPKSYHHVVVGLEPSEVTERNDYIHLPDDPIFHRITYIDDRMVDGVGKALFLVQLRARPDEISDIVSRLGRLFERCGIAPASAVPIVHATMSRQFMQRRDSAGKTRRRRDQRIVHLQTIGDLAYCVVLEENTLASLRAYGVRGEARIH
jgi:hypothetical protein